MDAPAVAEVPAYINRAEDDSRAEARKPHLTATLWNVPDQHIDWERQLPLLEAMAALCAKGRAPSFVCQCRGRRVPTRAAAARAAMIKPWAPAHTAAGPGRDEPMTAPAAVLDIIDPRVTADIADPIDNTLAALQSDKALPTEPIEPTLPTDPTDRTDPRLATLRIESVEAMDHLDDM